MKASQGFVNLWLGVEIVVGPLRFTSKDKCQSDHGVQGPQKIYLKAYIIHWHGPMDFVLAEAKEVL